MTRRTLPAAVLAVLSALLMVLLIFLGSRGLKDFDSALVGYAVATVFALAAIVYRYTLWITRPPTWRYFKGGWVNFLSWRNFRRYTTLIPLAWWHDVFGQTFILRRSLARWVAHMSIFWGVLLSLAITLPLTFGWLRFTLVPQYFAGRTGTVTGIVGAAGGLGGFFPPLILGAVRQTLGSYTIGFALLALMSLLCFLLNQQVLSRWSANPLRHTKPET